MAFPEKTPAEGGAVMSVRATSTSERQAIGDHKRSPSASFTFFSHLDLDGDGKLAEKEVASFLWDEIGGADFDSTSEVNTEVDNVIRDLDVNHDKTLDRSDIFQYWAKMETLLTCEEVADWVVFAVQLPESIGRYVYLHTYIYITYICVNSLFQIFISSLHCLSTSSVF
jgi:hypothetical protein